MLEYRVRIDQCSNGLLVLDPGSSDAPPGPGLGPASVPQRVLEEVLCSRCSRTSAVLVYECSTSAALVPGVVVQTSITLFPFDL